MCMFEGSVLGASSKVETPDPIPNSAVKRFRANGSRKARVGQCREHYFQTKLQKYPEKGYFLLLIARKADRLFSKMVRTAT